MRSSPLAPLLLVGHLLAAALPGCAGRGAGAALSGAAGVEADAPVPATVRAGSAPLRVPEELRQAYRAASEAVPGLRPDARLAAAAAAVAEQVASSGAVPVRRAWMEAVRRAGVAEPVPALLVVSGAVGDGRALPEALGTRLASRVRGLRCNRIGIARRQSGPTEILVALAVASHLTLEPVPIAVDRGSGLRLRGRVSREVTDLEVLVATPEDRVLEVPGVEGSRFDGVVETPLAGEYRIEVLGDIDGSPVVLANFSVTVGPGTGRGSRGAAPPGATVDPVAARQRLFDLMNETRVRAGLLPLEPHPSLDQAAAAYAEDMAARGFFGHRDPEGRGPGARAALAGCRAPLVLENLSRAPTAEEAHLGLLESPAHLRSMLEPRATHAGIGVHGEEDLGLWVVELMARVVPPVEPEQAGRQVLEAIAEARAARSAPPLRRDLGLDRAAAVAADRVASDSSTPAEALEAARAALSTLPLAALRAVVVRTPDLEEAGGIEAALDPALDRVGVAVRAAGGDQGGYHLVVLLAR